MSAGEPATEPQSPRRRAHRSAAHVREIWKRAYAARSTEDLESLYADWAATYDNDHDQVGYFGHIRAAEVLARHVPFARVAPILDAGAGTGAAGVELAKRGFENLTALDLSVHMLERARSKGVYRHTVRGDLGLPLDGFPVHHFDAAILVGVFSYGQAPAHALDEIVRVVKPGGVVVFTVRTDFFGSDAMGVRSRVEALERSGALQLVQETEPELYLPKKDPSALFTVRAYRVLENKIPRPKPSFAAAVRKAMSSPGPVKRIDHSHIWNSMASRLYERYADSPEYYLIDCEEEILRSRAEEMVGPEALFVELGCGSARKVRHVLDAALRRQPDVLLSYVPIDLSAGALSATQAEIAASYGGRIRVEPRLGRFDAVLPATRRDAATVLLFFGGSLGNIESLPETVAFLRTVRERMGPRDRFLVGVDLHKEEQILRRAYEAGPPNRSFFLNMLRRINNELGANLDLDNFEQRSTYDRYPPYYGVEDRCVSFKLVTRSPQSVFISQLDLGVHLRAGDAIQVGVSRKLNRNHIGSLMSLAGLRLCRQWLDERQYFSLNEVVAEDAHL